MVGKRRDAHRHVRRPPPRPAGAIKALSIKQPYPHHIFHDGKDVENRDWPTRGRAPDSGYGRMIMWGDGLLNDVSYGHVNGRMGNHPLDRQIAALNALDRAPDLFRKFHVKAYVGPGERIVRCFELIGTPRPFQPKDPQNED